MPAAPPPGTMYLRESWRVRIATDLLLIAFVVVLTVRSDGRPHVAWLIFWALLVAVELYRIRRPVATLTSEKIVVHNLRPREIPWARIQEVGTVKRLATTRVTLVTDDGGAVVMDGPTAFFFVRGPFDASVATIREWWVRHRGGDWAARTSGATSSGSAAAPEG